MTATYRIGERSTIADRVLSSERLVVVQQDLTDRLTGRVAELQARGVGIVDALEDGPLPTPLVKSRKALKDATAIVNYSPSTIRKLMRATRARNGFSTRGRVWIDTANRPRRREAKNLPTVGEVSNAPWLTSRVHRESRNG